MRQLLKWGQRPAGETPRALSLPARGAGRRTTAVEMAEGIPAADLGGADVEPTWPSPGALSVSRGATYGRRLYSASI